MSNPIRQPRGFCPGVWTPMESGDGLIVRVHPARARLAAHQLRELARLAQQSGNGIIELTRRANLQVRGVSASSVGRLQAELVRLGLADAQPDAEKRPALLVCPLSGIDVGCPPLEPLAHAVEAVLRMATFGAPLADKCIVVLSGVSSPCDG